jgi:phage gpG-like protein
LRRSRPFIERATTPWDGERMGIRYDASKLHGFMEKLLKLQDPRLTSECSQRIGVGFTKLVADEFKTSTGPDGKPWKSVERNRKRDRLARARRARAGKPIRGDKPLIDSGRMSASVTAIQSGGNVVRVAIPVDYAIFHQQGTSKMERRQMLPEGELPPKWRDTAEKEAALLLAQKAGVE